MPVGAQQGTNEGSYLSAGMPGSGRDCGQPRPPGSGLKGALASPFQLLVALPLSVARCDLQEEREIGFFFFFFWFAHFLILASI